MKIKSGPIQTVLAAFVAIGITIVCLNLFGVFVGHDSIREAIQASKGTVIFSMVIGVLSYLAIIWVTSLNTKELEDLEVRSSISEDINATIASLRKIQQVSKENNLGSKVQNVTNFVVNAVNLSIQALITNIQPQDMAMAAKLHELTIGYENALRAFVLNSKQASFDNEAAQHADEFRSNAPLMLIGFVNIMKEIQSNDGSLSTATKEIMAKLGAWGYIGELDKLNEKNGKG